MRTFVMKDTQRFWSIQRDKKKVTVRYGKVGGKMTSHVNTFANVGQATSRYQQQIAEKLKAGYDETTADDLPPMAPTGQALESALVENPDDLAAHMAFADWLSEQIDVRLQERGEFIRVQLQLEDETVQAAQRKKLQKREKDLLTAHERRWLGWRLFDLLFDGGGSGASWIYSPDRPDEVRSYRRGWLDLLKVPMMSPEVAKRLAESPGLRLLRELTLDDGMYDVESLDLLVEAPALGNVRVLRVLECPDEGSIAPLVARLPWIEVLELRAIDLDLGNLFALKTLNHLRELFVEDAQEYDVAALAKNPSLGKLRKLALIPDWTERDHGPHVSLSDVRALAKSKHLRSLTSLTIHRTDAGDDGVDAIVAGGLLSQLTELDLSNGCITDRGALALAAAPGFRNLQQLTLAYNRLTKAGITALKRPGLKLDARDQQDDDEFGDYDDDYLYDDWDLDSDYDDDDWE